jgi:TIR domain
MTEDPIKVFFSYAHRDEKFKDELVNHLSILQRQGVISSWHDRMILPGSEWDREIDANLSSADIILLMVSSDFLRSFRRYRRMLSQLEVGQIRMKRFTM